LVDPKSGFSVRFLIKSQKSLFALLRASARRKSRPLNQPALAEKPGEAKPGEFPGLLVFSYACLSYAAFWAKAPGFVSSSLPPAQAGGNEPELLIFINFRI
jgi:hypothetical protein